MLNKLETTSLRNLNFKHCPANQHNELIELEKEFGKYCFLPLAIPKIQDDNFVSWFHDHKKAITKIKPDVADTVVGYTRFNSVNVCLDDRYIPKDPIWSDNQYPAFKKDFPLLYQQMMDLLPLKYNPRFSFWNSTGEITPHRDHSFMVDTPNSFRVMIQDENLKDTLYVYEDCETQGPKKYVPSLQNTNSFVWNNLRVKHGSDYYPGYSKILLILNTFIPDYKKYSDLLRRSASLYSEHTLVSEKNISNFVNLP